MAAPKGNRFWEARSKSGRSKIFETPEDLRLACCDYFEWVEENPLWEAKAFPFQGQVTVETVPKMRAMTKAGLCLFLDISDTTWDTYRAREDFSGVVSWAEKVIYTQKFSGAAADLLNPNIIARDLGLSDKTQTEHSGKIEHNDSELDRKLSELLSLVKTTEN